MVGCGTLDSKVLLTRVWSNSNFDICFITVAILHAAVHTPITVYAWQVIIPFGMMHRVISSDPLSRRFMVHPHDSINQRRVGTKDSKARRTAFGADAYGDERDQRDERDVRDHDSRADKRDQPRDRHSRKDSRAGDTRNKDFRAGDTRDARDQRNQKDFRAGNIRNLDARADKRDQPRDRHSRKDSRAGDTRNKDFRAGDIRNTDLRADARDQRADQRNHGH